MDKHKEILIAGAGPSGLSTAIFLHAKGYHPRIVDKKSAISPWSKAFGVNPRTLSILEEFDVAKRFLDNGRKMTAMNVWRNGKLFFRNELFRTKHKFPFLIIQSQRESEIILHETLAECGITVEYGTQLQHFTASTDGFEATLMGQEQTSHHADILIGADGGHSEVRHQLEIGFERFGYHGTWELYDVELDVDLPQDDANLFFFNEGGMIMIRIKDNLWRAAGNLPQLLNYLPKNTKVGAIPWQTKFNVNHIVATQLTRGNAVLIGDAAHVHSPFGGRGMNLGIQDAYIVSSLIHENRLNEYSAMRLPYLRKTVTRVNTLSTFITANSGFPLFIKKCAWMGQPFLPLAKPMIRNFAMGIS